MKRRKIGTLLRHKAAPEEIEFHAHEGQCRYCYDPQIGPGIVKMYRSLENGALHPEKCWCLGCGQRYYVTTSNIKEWEQEQWKQKAVKLEQGG
jgi:hypothetical protein